MVPTPTHRVRVWISSGYGRLGTGTRQPACSRTQQPGHLANAKSPGFHVHDVFQHRGTQAERSGRAHPDRAAAAGSARSGGVTCGEGRHRAEPVRVARRSQTSRGLDVDTDTGDVGIGQRGGGGRPAPRGHAAEIQDARIGSHVAARPVGPDAPNDGRRSTSKCSRSERCGRDVFRRAPRIECRAPVLHELGVAFLRNRQSSCAVLPGAFARRCCERTVRYRFDETARRRVARDEPAWWTRACMGTICHPARALIRIA